MEISGKVIITGTGRAGTTFLSQLFTRLGFDTGFDDDPQKHIFSHCNAGYEILAENLWNIERAFRPHVVKSPYLCDNLGTVLMRGYKIDYVIVPVRRLVDAAASRARHGYTQGGLWASGPGDQERVLAEKLGKLFTALVMKQLPYITMRFPELVDSSRYTYDCLLPLFEFYQHDAMDFDIFREAFDSLANPDLVHRG